MAEVKVIKDLTFQDWEKKKGRIIRGLKGTQPTSFRHSRDFYSLIQKVKDCPEIEAEKIKYGLEPPPSLKRNSEDSQARDFAKKILWRCYLGNYCSGRALKREKSDLPTILAPLVQDTLWKALKPMGFENYNAGQQFICISHLRHTPEARDSRVILNHWLLHGELPQGVLFFMSGSKEKWTPERESQLLHEHRVASYNNKCYWEFVTGIRTEKALICSLGSNKQSQKLAAML